MSLSKISPHSDKSIKRAHGSVGRNPRLLAIARRRAFRADSVFSGGGGKLLDEEDGDGAMEKSESISLGVGNVMSGFVANDAGSS